MITQLLKRRTKVVALILMPFVFFLADCHGSLSFQKSSVTLPSNAAGAQDIAAIDFNSDGSLDLVITRLAYPPTYPATYVPVVARKNLGHGTFTDASASVLGNLQTVHARDLRLGDFDGDGRMDLFIADHGTDTSPFPGGQSLLLSQTSDGRLRNDTTNRLPQMLAFTHHASIGDVDGDLDPDIYLANVWNNAQVGPRIYLNDGAATFSQSTRLPPEILSLQNRHTASLFLDVEDDGDLDLVLGGHNGTEDHDRILLNDGHGNFTYALLDSLPLRHGGIHWDTIDIASGDFDGDGYSDLLMDTQTNSYQLGFIQLLLNNHDGTFRDASTNIVQSWPAPANNNWIPFVRPVDLDSDGDLDFVCNLNFGASYIFLNDGTGKFTNANQLIPSGTPSAARIIPGDFDGDGNPDLFVLGYSQGALLRNLLPPRVASYSSTKTNQAIVFPRIGKVTNGPVTLNAVTSSGLPVSYEVLSGAGTVSGNRLGFTGTGVVVVRATQPGNTYFNSAAPVEQQIPVTGLFLSSIGVFSNRFGFSLSGESNQTVVVDVSTDFVNWTPLKTNTLGTAPLLFSDPMPPTLPVRFYRARLQ